jgi:hypothetical protein
MAPKTDHLGITILHLSGTKYRVEKELELERDETLGRG